MRYPIEHYDKHGFLKVPVWLWLGWIFLAKAWVVFVVAGVSRESGGKLLEIIYPVRQTLYIGLGMGLPSIIMMWLIGLRDAKRPIVNRIMTYGREYSLLITVSQLGLVIYQIILSGHRFSWAHSISAVLLVWFILFLLQSKRVKTCLRAKHLD